MKIQGAGEELLCDRTNARAKRLLSRSPSDAYSKRWQDLTPGTRFDTFYVVHLGLAILGVGERHLMESKPNWLSQLGPGKLFEKIPTDLYRLWNNNFVAHRHKDTLLFKKSIREQRIRFYGNKELNEIIYGNSKKAREPPSIVSGDETITRLYTSKATDVRMRTSKKNE